jgi:AcrR family transcriptional regulator
MASDQGKPLAAIAAPRHGLPCQVVGGAESQDQVANGKPPALARAEARRRQVLEAAAVCFQRQGFHCASMAEISKAAGMSPGHIYHYFENKEAIINAIVQMDLEHVLSEMSEREREGDDILASILSHVDAVVEEHLDKHRASLMLEVLAEAGRNPKAAAIVQEADAKIRRKLCGLLMASRSADAFLDQGDLEGRVEILTMMFRGLSARAIANPGLDKDSVARVMRRTVEHLFGLPG